MATIDVKVPSVGESVQEAILAEWFKQDGDRVEKDEPIFVIETDKVTLEVNAEAAGVLHIQVEAGETVQVGAVVATIDTEGAAAGAEAKDEEETEEKSEETAEAAEPDAEAEETSKESTPEKKESASEKGERPKPSGKEAAPADESSFPPSVRRLIDKHEIDPDEVEGTGPGGRITKGDMLSYLEARQSEPAKKTTEKAPPKSEAKKPDEKPAQKKAKPAEAPKKAKSSDDADEPTERKPMTPIRRRIAARLLEARRNTAMLTTFNDVDMTRAMALRTQYKEAFKKRHDVSLGFMSFFLKASVAALQEFPAINAFIEGDDVVYHRYYHIGVAIGSDRGLVVPVIRHADKLSFAGIEKAIIDYVAKIKENKLELADLEGGTFTITNGGVFGSMLSTPILNTPQSGILGMHRIEKRPVVVDDEIVIRPMMYLALSYDHRIVDGREAVTFLRRIKENIEDPERMLIEV
jgi:2-oxoglutarate dehydrogenase E2 component (dihydrolipoamide succinyltransferase)